MTLRHLTQDFRRLRGSKSSPQAYSLARAFRFLLFLPLPEPLRCTSLPLFLGFLQLLLELFLELVHASGPEFKRTESVD